MQSVELSGRAGAARSRKQEKKKQKTIVHVHYVHHIYHPPGAAVPGLQGQADTIMVAPGFYPEAAPKGDEDAENQD